MTNIGSKVNEKGGGGLGFEFSGDSVEDSQLIELNLKLMKN